MRHVDHALAAVALLGAGIVLVVLLVGALFGLRG